MRCNECPHHERHTEVIAVCQLPPEEHNGPVRLLSSVAKPVDFRKTHCVIRLQLSVELVCEKLIEDLNVSYISTSYESLREEFRPTNILHSTILGDQFSIQWCMHGTTSPMGSHICATLARHPLFERFVKFATISLFLKETFIDLWPRKSGRPSSDWLTFLLLECHALT